MNVFDKAIEVLRDRGWSGRHLEDDEGRVCAGGALLVALFGSDWEYTTEDFDISPRYIAACQTLARVVMPDEPPDFETISLWNDCDALDVDGVIGAMKLASELHDLV